jgi:hypothetical protein
VSETVEERRARHIEEALVSEIGQPEQWWWLSFADGRLPAGSQFLGVAIVKAPGLSWATRRTHELGINPGGEVVALQFPDWASPPDGFTDRLLTRAEAESMEAHFDKQGAEIERQKAEGGT